MNRKKHSPKKSAPKKNAPSRSAPVHLLIGTRKGAFTLKSDATRKNWKLSEPVFLGHIVHHWVLDPRDRKTLLMACRTGHLGPTVFRSTNRGKTWSEAVKPPAFPKVPDGEKGLVVNHVFWLSPGHASEPNVWYAGTSPQGLFKTEDGGVTWEGVSGFNENPMREKWTGGEQDGTPDGPKLHSILIDPRDANHMYIGCSSGGVFESSNKGRAWRPVNQGCLAEFLPLENPEYGHDPHCVQLHPLKPDRLYQQNHCGIYRMDCAEGKWIRIGENMPKKIGDIGFPIVLHPRNADKAWVFPMDGTTVWPRTSPDGKPAVYATADAGISWKRLDKGLPEKEAWFTVLRQAMTCDTHDTVGIYFGTTCGEIWGSRDEGKSWNCMCRNLPEVYSLHATEL